MNVQTAVDSVKALIATLLTVLAAILIVMSFAVLWDATDDYAYAVARWIQEVL